MPDESQLDGEFALAWKRFVSALRQLWSGVSDERILDPYLPLRDATLNAMESPFCVADLQSAWLNLHGLPVTPGQQNTAPEVAHLLFIEVNAFPSAVEIAKASEKDAQNSSSNKKRLLGIGKTIIQSTGDILEMSPITSGILKVAGEVSGIIRGE